LIVIHEGMNSYKQYSNHLFISLIHRWYAAIILKKLIFI
jgi:hypothetical protein